MKNNLRFFREKKGLSQVQLAKLVNSSQPQINRLEMGDRKLTVEWAERIAPHLGVEAAALNYSVEELDRARRSLVETPLSKHRHVPIVGYVEAGVFQEAITMEEEQWEYRELMVDPRYSGLQSQLLEVRGNSMNEVIPSGSLVEIVEFYSINQEPEPGRYYVVDRIRPDGTIEATLKQFQIDDAGTPWLVPRSTDPQFKAAIPLSGSNGDQIVIRALVIRIILTV